VLQSQSARRFNSTLSFGLIMNLVVALGTQDQDLTWKYLVNYDPMIANDPETEKMARTLVECALNFYRDFIEPAKRPYVPKADELKQLTAWRNWLIYNPTANAEEIEKAIYEIGRQHYDKPGKIFPLLYLVILSQDRGPRLGALTTLLTSSRVIEASGQALKAAEQVDPKDD
ncbi:MAG: hypothetical protein WB999_10370, partial [Candidatus Binataceae bacterium]